MTLKEILQNMVNEPYENLLGTAREALDQIMPVFNGIAEDGDGGAYAILLMATSLAVDGKFTDLEYRFISDLLGGIKYEAIANIVEAHYDEALINLADNLIDSCPTKLKASLLTFCCCFMAVDETISREEVAFINKLIEE